MKKFEIWCEGYISSGNRGRANCFGSEEANNFKDACISFFAKREDNNYFDIDKMTYWGCRLFDNEIDARKSFG